MCLSDTRPIMAAGSEEPSLLEAKAVAVFGDSWAEDNAGASSGMFAGVQGWPMHLARMLDLPVAGNFARGQSESASLPKQLEVADQQISVKDTPHWSDLLVVLHSGGNDFIGAEKNYNPFARNNFWLAHCTWGFHKKAEEVVTNLHNMLLSLYARGCRRFLVSDLPFTSAVPALVVARMASVNQRGDWMSNRIREMLAEFSASCASAGAACSVVLVSEIAALNRLAGISAGCAGSASAKLFLRDAFHPTDETHRRLAEEHAAVLAKRCPGSDPDVPVTPVDLKH